MRAQVGRACTQRTVCLGSLSSSTHTRLSASSWGGVVSNDREEREQSTGSRVEYLVVPWSLKLLDDR